MVTTATERLFGRSVFTAEEVEDLVALAVEHARDEEEARWAPLVAGAELRAVVAERALIPHRDRADAAEAENVRLCDEFDRLVRGLALAVAQRDARLIRLRWAEALQEGGVLALALAKCLGERSWREGRYRAVWVGLAYPTAEAKAVLCAVCGVAGGIILALALTGFGG